MKGVAHMQSVLVVAAHPDDEVLGCGGTICRLAEQGAKVRVLLMADGVSSRRDDGDSDITASLERRRESARLAAHVLGVDDVEFASFPDNRMDAVDRLDVTRIVEQAIARWQPDTLFTHHAGDLNVDHRRVHEAVMTACRPQPGASVTTILCFEVPSSTEWQAPGAAAAFQPNWFCDITSTLERRGRALEAYGAEMRPWPHARSHEALVHLARWRGATVGVAAAEAFILARHIERDTRRPNTHGGAHGR